MEDNDYTNRLGQNVWLMAFDPRGVCRSEVISENERLRLNHLVEGGFLAMLYAFRYPIYKVEIISRASNIAWERVKSVVFQDEGISSKRKKRGENH